METYNEISDYLLTLMPEEEAARNTRHMAELCRDSTVPAETYFQLSRAIPKDWTVIDFGAAHSALCCLFAGHKKYIAVNPDIVTEERVGMSRPANCEICRLTAKQYIYRVDYPKSRVFAICNCAPRWFGEDSVNLVHEKFRDCFTFRPETGLQHQPNFT